MGMTWLGTHNHGGGEDVHLRCENPIKVPAEPMLQAWVTAAMPASVSPEGVWIKCALGLSYDSRILVGLPSSSGAASSQRPAADKAAGRHVPGGGMLRKVVPLTTGLQSHYRTTVTHTARLPHRACNAACLSSSYDQTGHQH
jgi:hypothetical protein